LGSWLVNQLREDLRTSRAAVNPDVFITIVFVGIAVLAALVGLVFVVPQIRRDAVRVSRSRR